MFTPLTVNHFYLPLGQIVLNNVTLIFMFGIIVDMSKLIMIFQKLYSIIFGKLRLITVIIYRDIKHIFNGNNYWLKFT
jgi:ABC-type transport system involved in Fe-S cluster assembly fused permease/ATPase subunit